MFLHLNNCFKFNYQKERKETFIHLHAGHDNEHKREQKKNNLKRHMCQGIGYWLNLMLEYSYTIRVPFSKGPNGVQLLSLACPSVSFYRQAVESTAFKFSLPCNLSKTTLNCFKGSHLGSTQPYLLYYTERFR